MKNLFKSMMLVAAAAMGFTACSTDTTEDVTINPTPALATKTVTVTADITRTEFNAERSWLQWTTGDQVGAYTDVDKDRNIPSKLYEGTDDEKFEFSVDEQATRLYAYYPYYQQKDNVNERFNRERISIYVSETQTQTDPGKLAGENYPLVAAGTIADDNTVALSFRPIACALAFNVYNTNGDAIEVKSISLSSTDASTYFTGQQLIDLTGDLSTISYTAEHAAGYTINGTTYPNDDSDKHKTPKVTLTKPFTTAAKKPADTKTFEKQVYLVVAKKAYTGVTVTVTDTAGKEYKFVDKAIDCSTADVRIINLDLTKGETNNIPEGDYVILAHPITDNTFYAMSTDANSSRRARVEFAYNGTDETVFTDNEKIVWHIAKGTSGYTIASSDNQYINYVEKGASLSSTSAEFPVSFNEDGTYTIKNAAESYRLALNGIYGFGFYSFSGDTGTGKVFLIPVELKILPKCTIDTFTAEWNADKTAVVIDGEYTNTYTTEPTWTLTVSKNGGDAESLEVIGEEGIIVANDYTVSEDGSYTFTLTATIDGNIVATESTTITKEGEDSLSLSFDFTTADAKSSFPNYEIDGTTYTFIQSSASNVYMNNGYLMIKSNNALGLPAIEGYKLTKVEGQFRSGGSTASYTAISSDQNGTNIVEGGANQQWEIAGQIYTYYLTNTTANTTYYMYVSNKNAQYTKLVLTYTPAE